MIKVLIDMPEIVFEKMENKQWDLTVAGFKGRFWLSEKKTGILFIALDLLTLPISLFEQWQRQFSIGDIPADLALVKDNDCYWLAQRLDNTVDIPALVALQIKLVGCLQTQARAQHHIGVSQWGQK